MTVKEIASIIREETGICWRDHAIIIPDTRDSRRVFRVNTVAPMSLHLRDWEYCAMSRQDDDKAARLRRDGCLHPAPEQVTDGRFDDMTFFDRRDLLQVKYEMLRRVRVDGLSVSESARRHGLSRPTYYAAQRGLDDPRPDRPAAGQAGPENGPEADAGDRGRAAPGTGERPGSRHAGPRRDGGAGLWR